MCTRTRNLENLELIIYNYTSKTTFKVEQNTNTSKYYTILVLVNTSIFEIDSIPVVFTNTSI